MERKQCCNGHSPTREAEVETSSQNKERTQVSERRSRAGECQSRDLSVDGKRAYEGHSLPGEVRGRDWSVYKKKVSH